jgi:hypothetical protein
VDGEDSAGGVRMNNPRHLEPHFSFWMNELTAKNLHDKADIAIELAKLSKAIADIAPWLSASLESMTPCAEYREACEQIFRLDRDLT